MHTNEININNLASGASGVGGNGGNGVKRKSVGTEINQIRKQRRKIKIAGAPKFPWNGYVCYMNERRGPLSKEHSGKNFIELTKIIGEEWSKMRPEDKDPYMKRAEIDKERYFNELATFLEKNPNVLENEVAKEKPRKSNTGVNKGVLKEKIQINDNVSKTLSKELLDKSGKVEKTRSTQSLPAAPHTNNSNNNNNNNNSSSSNNNNNITTTTISNNTWSVPSEIPIFTNEFLEHNKFFDNKVRNIRKTVTDRELHNSCLQRNVEEMKIGLQKISHENDELEEKTRLLGVYLEKLKTKLANALAGLAIPTEPNGATVDNIFKYMTDLEKMSTSNTHGPASLNKAKDIIRKLDLQIQL